MVKRIHVGTSGWSYRKWKPRFYPAKVGSAKFLEYYASRINSVEVNYTFRNTLTAQSATRWCKSSSPGFLFSVKAPFSITHLKRMRDAGDALAEFVDSLTVLRLEGKLGPVFFQFPGNFKFDPKRLSDFLAVIPNDIQTAFEFRHESWFVDDTYQALKRAGCALCYVEDDKFTTPLVRTTDFEYWRLRKLPYSIADVSTKIVSRGTAADLFVYLKHEDSPNNAFLAAQLLSDPSKTSTPGRLRR